MQKLMFLQMGEVNVHPPPPENSKIITYFAIGVAPLVAYISILLIIILFGIIFYI